jgi:glycerophosphoryl diester phosphodiesterase
LANLTAADPIVIAHRGASGYLPEHTLAAKAMAHAMGADYLEQDVVMTRDGIPVVLHDIYLENTTDVERRFPDRARQDGRYYAADFDLAEIRQLRVHERSRRDDESGIEIAVYPGRFPLGTGLFRVPTLAEEIDLIAGLDRSRGRGTGLYIELKAPNWHRAEGHDMARAVLDVLREKGYAQRSDQVFLQCFDDSTLKRLREEFETPLPLIQLIGENGWREDTDADFDAMLTDRGLAGIARYADGIGPWLEQIYQGVDASGRPQMGDLVQRAHHHGLVVHPYTFRRDELPEGIRSFDHLLELFVQEAGVDGLFTDFPDLVRRYLERRHDLPRAGSGDPSPRG